jgi:hypothetical protein
MDEEREIEWPEPREDPDEEPFEPWARRREELMDRWRGWDDVADAEGDAEPELLQ